MKRNKLAVIAALLIAAACGSAQAGPARLYGKVLGKPKVEPGASSGSGAYASRVLRYATLFNYKSLKDVVVYVEPVAASSAAQLSAPAGNPILTFTRDRRGIQILPPFLVVTRESRLEVRNDTNETLIAFSGGDSARRVARQLPPRSKQVLPPSSNGLYRVHCIEDPNAEAKLFVAGSTFSLTDPHTGRYSLELPPGEYDVTAWHARLPSQTQRVVLMEDKKLELDFTLTVENLYAIK